ncbi:hypothetical protein AK812_SmicGene33886 [Symbiodinium microadriaticum]|uniref:Uncharacterized protein n=1 Tax=Symbiodinium microadriaticum TaxID=2951 RepID=A0A1Q9CQI6_SYMMI|nr:hypothetical protein AK812_SmicGene33886 [Symbiodinium microadriaticum]
MPFLSLATFHWICGVLTAPFGVLSFFMSNPEKVKFVEDKVAIPLPKRVLGFCSQFAHLTIVSHELTSGYFVWAILRDHGVLQAPLDTSNTYFELYFVVAVSVALFVAFVFWASALIDPALMAPVDVMFPAEYRLTPELKQHLLFGAMFGPSDPDPRCSWQTPFRLFMQYIHTLCPLLLVVDMALGDHPLNKSSLEINATVGFAYSYLAWNFFCWWLLRTPPYPLQKRFFELGIPWAVFAYAVLTIFALSMCAYSRWIRAVSGWLGVSVLAAAVSWASTGLWPWKGAVARFQGLDPAVLQHGWSSGDKPAFFEKEEEEDQSKQKIG